MPDRPRRELVVADTSVWVALLVNEADRAEHVVRLLERAESGELQVLVSTLTLTEVVKGPMASDPPVTQEQERTFTDFMDNPYVTLVSVDPLVGARGRDLRRTLPHLKTPDAIQIATAIVSDASTLYTYDKRDLLRLDGSAAVGSLRIIEPPVEHQLPLALAEPSTSAMLTATGADDSEPSRTDRDEASPT